MLATVLAHLRQQWMGALALFLVIAGGSAYAADTVFSTDIVDGEVKAEDIATAAVRTQELRTDQIRSVDVRDDYFSDGGLRTEDIAGDALLSQDIAQDTLTGADISDGSLTGADVDLSTLGFPGAIQALKGTAVFPVGPNYNFGGGETVGVTTTVAQPRITGAASVPLRSGSASVESADVGLCYDATPGVAPPPVNFVGSDYQTLALDGLYRSVAASASVTLDPGTYEVGFCMRKIAGTQVVTDLINGWVMRTG